MTSTELINRINTMPPSTILHVLDRLVARSYKRLRSTEYGSPAYVHALEEWTVLNIFRDGAAEGVAHVERVDWWRKYDKPKAIV